MKKLYLVRHAKSDWTHDIPDFDRPLNERGHSDAPKMARYLLENGFEIQHFISSPAKRVLTTCRYFAEIFGNSKIEKVEDLYEPLIEDFYNTVSKTNKDSDSIAIFSHNPTVSEFASSIAQQSLEFPTCAVAVFEIDCDDWSEFESAGKRLTHFLKPKELFY